jgi:chromosomal replication initiator protein
MTSPLSLHQDGAGQQRIPTIAEIQAAVCEKFAIGIHHMTADKRSRHLARPRQIAMYLAYELTPKSLPQIGRLFGDRDHTTVLHGYRTVEALIVQDRDFAAVVAELRQSLEDPGQLILPPASKRQVVAAQYARLVA